MNDSKHEQQNEEQENQQEETEKDTCRSEEPVLEEVTDNQSETETERARLEREKEDLVAQVLRLKADFDNYRRRTANQVEQIRQNANKELAAELLPVLDNFERALTVAEQQADASESKLADGVKMVYQQLLACLTKQGLQPIECVGKPFNPEWHEAVSMVGESGDDLVVTAELQRGYFFQDCLLRASMVEVSRSGASCAEEAADDGAGVEVKEDDE